MSFSWIFIVIIGIIWNVFKRLRQAEEGRQARSWQAERVQSDAPHATDRPQGLPIDLPDEEGETLEGAPQAPLMTAGARGAALTRQASAESPASAPAPLMSKQNLTHALILREVLSEPRSKAPWRPHRNRR